MLRPRLRCSARGTAPALRGGAAVAVLGWALVSLARPAQACTWAQDVGAWTPAAYEVDQALRATDSMPPSAFTEVTVLAFRVPAEICNERTCTLNTCGDAAAVQLSFVRPSDDQTPSADLGYRIELIEGAIPASMLDHVAEVRPLASILSFDVNFQEIETLDAVIALVAVDRAGNESAPSAPIHITYSGCVKPSFEGACIEHDDGNGTDCSIASLAPGTNPSRPRGWLALAALGWVLALGRRRQRAADCRARG